MSVLTAPRTGRRSLAALRGVGGSWLFYVCLAIVVGFVLVALLAPFLAPYNPDATDLSNALAPPEPCALAGHRRGRPRHPVAADLRDPDQPGGTAGGRRVLDRPRHRRRAAGRLAPRLGRRSALARRRHPVRVPGTAAGDPGGVAVRQGADGTGGRHGRRVHAVRRAAGAEPGDPGRSRPYVAAYQVQGFGPVHIAVRRLLPNVSPSVLAQSTLNFGYALLDLAALSFLGLGVQPPTADWGSMVDDGRGARCCPGSRCRRWRRRSR